MSDAGPTPAEAELPLRFRLASRHRRLGRAAVDVVDVERDAEPPSLHHLFRRLNECTRQHGIRLLPWRTDDRGRGLAGVWTVSA